MLTFAGDVHHRDDLLLPGGALPGPLPHGALRQLRPHQGPRQVHRASGKFKQFFTEGLCRKISDLKLFLLLALIHLPL
jgi:hypothetical protein